VAEVYNLPVPLRNASEAWSGRFPGLEMGTDCLLVAGSTNSVAFLETCLLNFELQFKARYLSSTTGQEPPSADKHAIPDRRRSILLRSCLPLVCRMRSRGELINKAYELSFFRSRAVSLCTVHAATAYL